MSCANMGISQLECLQLRRLVGPTGIGEVSRNVIGDPSSTTNIANIPLIRFPDGTYSGVYVSPLMVPSGTGVMQVTIQCNTAGGAVLYYAVFASQEVSHGQEVSYGFPVNVNLPQEGISGYFDQGLMMYTNPTSSPVPVCFQVGASSTIQSVGLISMSVKNISYGPYVQQE